MTRFTSAASGAARLLVEELEPRILYSADAAALVHPGALLPSAEVRALETYAQPAAVAAHAAAVGEGACAETPRREIVFIDAAISGYEQLLTDLYSDTACEVETVMLDSRASGIDQISNALSGRQDVAAIHILSHGIDGGMQLGADTLGTQSLAAYAEQIRGWGKALTSEADILIYGCDVAANTQGRALVDALGRLTGADVAASIDLTGSAARGGDWDLEYRTGSVESGLAFRSADAIWSGTLLASPAGGEIPVTSTAGDVEDEASVAMDANGNYAVAYSSDLGGASYGVRMVLYDAAGTALTGEIAVNATTAGDQRRPSVAMDPSGDIVVVWSSDGQDGSGTGIYFQRYNAAGVAQGAETQVNNTSGGQQDRPRVAIDGSGNFVVTWTTDQGGDLDVYARLFAADGTAIGNEFLVNTLDAANNQDEPAIAMDTAGNFVIAWRTGTTLDGSGTGIFAQRYNAAGATVGAPFQVNSTGAGNQSDPSVAMSAAGFVVSWTSAGQDGSGNGVFAQRYSAAGATLGSEFPVNTTTADDQDRSSVAIDASGNFAIVWSSNNQDGSGRGVYGQAYDAAGTPFGTEFPVNTTTANAQDMPAIAMRASNGDFVVAWNGEGATDPNGIAAQRYQRVNNTPTISNITDQSTNEDVATGAIAFTVGDADTAAGSLTVQATSSNQAVVADASIVLGGAGANRTITLPPVGNAFGTTTITVTVSDGAAQATDTFVLTVNSVNDAPTITNGAAVTLAATNENTTSSATIVDAILTSAAWADVDTGASKGIAVTSKTGNGSWQYSTDGVTWNGFGAVSAANALLLTSTSQVRYLPDGLNGETATFAFRAWDQTSGTASTNGAAAYANPGAGGGSTAYSSQSATASMTVTAVNDAPTVTARALSFDGGDLVVVPPQPNLVMTSTMTMEATFQWNGTPGSIQIVANKEGEYEFAVSATGKLQWAFASTTPGWNWVETSFAVPADTWIHVSVTYNSGVVKTYVDGTLVDTFNGTGNIGDAHPALNNFTIGGRQNNTIERFDGLIDEVRIWNVERSAAEIQASYAAALAGNEAGLVGYWRFNESGGTTAVDSSTQGYNGVLGNGVPADVPARTTNLDYTTAEDNALVVGAAGVLTTATDPEGSVLTASLVSGPTNAAAFTLNLDGSFSYTPLADFNGTDTFVFTASDGSLASQQATVTITVTSANDPPVITSNGGGAAASLNVAENTTAVTTVTATDIDLPAQMLTYSIVGGADQAFFTIDANTGVLAFITARDFETPVDAGANNVYDVTVQASDGTLADTQAIAVTVTALNDNAPVITSNGGGASASVNVAENATAVTTVVATDADLPAQTLTYSVVGGADQAFFTIDANTGALSFITARNFEAPADAGANNVYDVTVQASDGTLTDTQAVAVTITPVNDNNPVITSNGGGASAAVNVAENATAATTVVATDADLPAQTLTYSIVGGADQAFFTIDANTGALSFITARDFEAPADAGANNVYDVTVQASDGTLADTQSIAVTITAVNDNSPVITSNGGGASAAVNVAENATAVTTVVATDADLPAQTLTYSIVGGADQALFAIDANTGALTFVTARNFEAPADGGANNVYDVTVQASDGTLTDTQAIAVTITPVNDNNPVITSNGGGASAAVNVAENATAVTTVVATDADLPAQTLTYSIVGGADQALFAIDVNTGALTFIAARDFEVPADAGANNVYDVIVQASDGTLTDTQAIAVTVTPVNDNNPIITSNGGGASAAINVAENATAVTTVTATDADLPAPTLTYSIVGGADQALFAIDVNTGVLTFITARNFEAPADAGANNVYDVTVQVSDGTLNDTQAIAVTVTPVNDNNPVITSNGGGASASVNVAENTTAVTTVVATDADLPAQTLTYSIVGGADQALFAIDANTGVLSFITARDFEVPADAGANNVYDVTVQVSDGTLTDTQAIAVTVTSVNDNTPIITSNGGGASASLNVAENVAAVTTVIATDADLPVQTLTYSIVGGADQALFSIDANTGALSFITGRDFEAPTDAGGNNVYDVTVQVSDGTFSDSQAIAVTVTPANDSNPVITSNGGGASASINVAENATAVTTVTATDADLPVQTLTYSIVGGADQAFFAIDANTGVLSFIAARDFEAPADAGANNVYDVTVQASDGSGGIDTQAIAVTVTLVNDNTPVITSNGGGASASINVAENVTAVTTVTATDIDLPAQTLTYSIVGGADQLFFTIDANTGVLSFITARDFEVPADAGANNVYDVTVQASDGTFNDSQAIAVTVTPVNDNNPVITSNGGGASASINVAENATAVTTVVATDADLPVQTLTYSIVGGADQALFAIDVNTGVLSFITARDFEVPADVGANNVYDVTVQVLDGSGGLDTQAIAVTITPVNDNNPVITSNGGGALASVNVAENATAVTTVVATDADLPVQTLTYSIVGGVDQALFAIDVNTGVLSFITARDFEVPADAGANNVYDVTVQASDGMLTDTQTIAVTITAVNDNTPVITSNGGGAAAAINVSENATAVTTVVATDADLPVQTLTYSIVGGADQAFFTIDANTGVLSFITARDFEVPADAGANNIYDVTVQASDGMLTDTQAIAVTVTPVNDNAPVIGAGQSFGIAENSVAATVVGTVVATDADSGTVLSAWTIAAGNSGGAFAIDSVTGQITVANSAALDFESTPGFTLTLSVSDGTLTSALQNVTINLTNVNEAPTLANPVADQGVFEDSPFVLVFAANTFADVDVPDALTYTTNGLPGWLGFNAATRTFSGTPAGSDVGTVTVVLTATDNGLAAASDTFDIVVTNVNDAPVGADAVVTTLEDTAYAFAPADFGFTDPADNPANVLTAVRVTTVPLAGQLTLSSAPVGAGQFVAVADIAAGNLRFAPALDANGSPYAIFTFQVQDDGGTANGGINLDTTPRTLTINVGAVADPPPFIPPPDPPLVQPPNPGPSVPGVSSPNIANTSPSSTPSVTPTTAGGTPTAPPLSDAAFAQGATLADAGGQGSTLSPSQLRTREEQGLRRISAPASVALSGEILRLLDSGQVTGDELRSVLVERDLPFGIRAAPSGRGAQGPEETQDQSALTLLTVENGVRLAGVVISAGALTWALQGAGLLASLVTSVPAWRHLDPLPVLAPDEEKPAWQDEKDRETQHEEDAASALWGDAPADAERSTV